MLLCTEDCREAVVTGVATDVVTGDVLRADEDDFGMMVEEALVEAAVDLLEIFVVLDDLASAIMMHWPF